MIAAPESLSGEDEEECLSLLLLAEEEEEGLGLLESEEEEEELSSQLVDSVDVVDELREPPLWEEEKALGLFR